MTQPATTEPRKREQLVSNLALCLHEIERIANGLDLHPEMDEPINPEVPPRARKALLWVMCNMRTPAGEHWVPQFAKCRSYGDIDISLTAGDTHRLYLEIHTDIEQDALVEINNHEIVSDTDAPWNCEWTPEWISGEAELEVK